MKKNGFIATSLIYSFFLVFITLFLTIIADHLQNKLLLNEIESGIKNNLNSSMSIKDFQVGDMISFVSDCSEVNSVNNQWVIANVNYEDKYVIFYSYDFSGNYPTYFVPSKEALLENDFGTDIEFGDRNNTNFSKIIYTFSGNNEYSVGEGRIVSKNCDGTSTGDFDYEKNCIKTGTSSNTRYRIVKKVGDAIYNKCTQNNSVITIIDVT